VGRDRTADTRIFSPLLYRLSYRTIRSFSIETHWLNRAAKIGDIPNKKAKNLKRIPVFLALILKKSIPVRWDAVGLFIIHALIAVILF
jgi:hypothetical protein